MSPYSRFCNYVLEGPKNYKSTKLTTTFNKRQRYVIHGVNLQTYIRLGMILTKVHRVIKFRQIAFLKAYILFCTKLRALAITKFEKDLFKLMANSVYGKTIEDVTKHLTAKIVRTSKAIRKEAGKPGFLSCFIINDEMAIIYSKKKRVVIYSPFAVGFTILEISKNYMYTSFYDHFCHYLNNPRVLFSDTDSLLIALSTKDIRKDLFNSRKMFDFSNYPTDHPLYSKEKQNLLGYFRDEMASKIIIEFIGLRSKVYSILSCDESKLNVLLNNPNYLDNKKVCKGIRKNVIKNVMRHEDYRRCLSDIETVSASMNVLRSNSHSISLQSVHKVAFTSFDCKRFLLHCGLHSIPFGHYILKYSENILCPFCK